MDAADALDEIAFLLERALAEPFKIKAFRTASVTISGLLVGELALRAADGRLAKTKGIGGRGLEVIRQALHCCEGAHNKTSRRLAHAQRLVRWHGID